MLYLDYSANTPVDEAVLQCFCEAERQMCIRDRPGVTGCSVSLLTNSMGVEGTAEDAAIKIGRASCRERV